MLWTRLRGNHLQHVNYFKVLTKRQIYPRGTSPINCFGYRGCVRFVPPSYQLPYVSIPLPVLLASLSPALSPALFPLRGLLTCATINKLTIPPTRSKHLDPRLNSREIKRVYITYNISKMDTCVPWFQYWSCAYVYILLQIWLCLPGGEQTERTINEDVMFFFNGLEANSQVISMLPQHLPSQVGRVFHQHRTFYYTHQNEPIEVRNIR
jgi:hypothetical protein